MVPQGGSSIAGACVAPLGKSRRASPARARGGCEIDSLGRCERQRIAPSNVGECVNYSPDAVCHVDRSVLSKLAENLTIAKPQKSAKFLTLILMDRNRSSKEAKSNR